MASPSAARTDSLPDFGRALGPVPPVTVPAPAPPLPLLLTLPLFCLVWRAPSIAEDQGGGETSAALGWGLGL